MEVCVDDTEMGRRRKARKAPPKRKAIEPLDAVFNCPFCNHEKSCDVKMDRARNTGYIACRVCLEDFQTSINCLCLKLMSAACAPMIYQGRIVPYLSEPVDVYSDWVDACENANM